MTFKILDVEIKCVLLIPFRYLRVTNGSEKRQILLAIFTVLHFSEEEKVSVKHKLMPGWFS